MPAPTPDSAPQDASESRPPETDAEDTGGGDAPPGKRRLFFILCAGVALAAGGAGYAVAVITAGPQALWPASAEAGETQTPAEGTEASDDALPDPKPAEETENYAYKDLEPITVNLDEPRLARYVHATVTLGILEEDFAKASADIDAETRVLRDWLTVYLTSLTLDDVRGPANLNRIRREILDAFNQELWPEGKPLIRKILFKEFAVK